MLAISSLVMLFFYFFFFFRTSSFFFILSMFFSRLCVICSIVFYWHIERFSTQRISLFAWICRLFFHLLDLILIVFASSTSFVLYKVFIWYACHNNVSASERASEWMNEANEEKQKSKTQYKINRKLNNFCNMKLRKNNRMYA